MTSPSPVSPSLFSVEGSRSTVRGNPKHRENGATHGACNTNTNGAWGENGEEESGRASTVVGRELLSIRDMQVN